MDGSLLAVQRRTHAAEVLADKFAGQLVAPVDPAVPVMFTEENEDVHVRHLQWVIDWQGRQTRSKFCEQLPEGGSMLLPSELQGVLW